MFISLSLFDNDDDEGFLIFRREYHLLRGFSVISSGPNCEDSESLVVVFQSRMAVHQNPFIFDPGSSNFGAFF